MSDSMQVRVLLAPKVLKALEKKMIKNHHPLRDKKSTSQQALELFIEHLAQAQHDSSTKEEEVSITFLITPYAEELAHRLRKTDPIWGKQAMGHFIKRVIIQALKKELEEVEKEDASV